MKIVELRKVPRNKIGKIIDHGSDREDHEYRTAIYLSSLGFDVELLKPSNIPHSKNPDIQMLGTVWEMKAPTSIKSGTNESMFRKAIKQAGGRAVFDLRRLKSSQDKAEKHFMDLFERHRDMRRMIIIKKDDQAVDINR